MRNGCGSESRKDERKQTESRVRRNERETRETGWNGSGEARKPKGREAAPDKQLRGEAGKKRKGRNRRLSSQNRKRSGRKKVEVRGKPESESKREAPVEQLWERNREG